MQTAARAIGFVSLLLSACVPPQSSSGAATPNAPAPSAGGAAVATTQHVASSAQEVVDAPDRDPEDRKLDQGRHPIDLLAFIGIRPGMRVAEIGAGGGYTSELLARAVGPSGAVYGQNSPAILQRFAEAPWSARLAKPVMKNVIRVDREFVDPFPPEARGLDAVVNVLFYHDTVWLNTDRDRMNRAVFEALRPGGVYIIVDHSAPAGAGVRDVQTLHRIEERVVKDEVARAGFRLAAEGSFLRSPTDTRDWNASPRSAAERRGTSDRFVLKFERPSM